MSKRIEFIDIAKGVAIFLVVFGHSSGLPSVIKQAIYSFHMPLFFILSGYFFKSEDIILLCKKMTPSIVRPYLVVGGLIVLIKVLSDLFLYSSFTDNATTNCLSLIMCVWKFGGETISIGAIWFLYVLFLSKLYLSFMLKKKHGIPIMIILATSSIVFSKLTHVVIPFGILQTLVCSQFLFIGYILNKKNCFGHFENTANTLDTPASYAYLLIALLIAFIPFSITLPVYTRINTYGYGMFSVIISSIISWLFVMFLKILLDNGYIYKPIKGFLLWSGRYTLIILCVHSVELEFVKLEWVSDSFILDSLFRYSYIILFTYICTKLPVTRMVFGINKK